MKERIIKLLNKDKHGNGKDYAKVWRSTCMNSEFKRDGFCHEWNYYTWAGMVIHHNIETDKIMIFCDCQVWREE